MFYGGNIFAMLAMATSFLILGMSLKDSLSWDFGLSNKKSTLLAVGLPLIIFIAGLRQFILAIDIVGGIFMSLEMFLIIYIYWRAKHLGDIKETSYTLHHSMMIAIIAIILLAVHTHLLIKVPWLQLQLINIEGR
jgi:amino acid permease